MTTQDLGGLSSDKRIDGVFHAYGFSIPIGKDGRRMWPKPFKQEMAKRMKSGTLTSKEIQKTCQVSEQTAYRWRKETRASDSSPKKKKQKFLEVKIQDEAPPARPQTDPILVVWKGVELRIGANYPVSQLAALVQQLGSAR